IARIITFEGCMHDGWLAFMDISDKLNKVFLLKLLNFYTEYFRRTAPDGTQPNLNTKIMKEFKVVLPPKRSQDEYVKIIEGIETKLSTIKESAVEMEKMYQSLLHKSFNGELFKEE